ncbi:hypothetical protein [Thalassococcus profundi]|jgi:hypothetical protein|nr:hypothetical protein [Thalassococcus profundi]
MTQTKTQIGDVTYNAMTQSFEALVTFYTDAGRVRVAAAYPAKLDADFAEVTDGLWHTAIRQLDAPDALQARLSAKRATERRQPRFVPQFTHWLRQITGHSEAA